MIKSILLYIGAVTIFLWGVAHIVIPTKDVIQGFGPISTDNRRIITMEWIMEGLTLCFIGLLVGLLAWVEGAGNSASMLVYRASALMLLVMAVVSFFTGARTSILPMKLCPPIFTTTALFFLLGSLP